nr:secretion protein EspA [Parashewanella curva]
MTGIDSGSVGSWASHPAIMDSSGHREDVYALQKKLNQNGKQSVMEQFDQQAKQHVSEHMAQLQGVDGMDKWDTDYQLGQSGDSVLSGGIGVLYTFMNLLSELANGKYLQMQEKAKVSRDAQDKANEVNEQIADVAKQGDKGTDALPSDVIKYMKDNDIQVDGKSIDAYLGNDETKKLDKGQLEAVKDALENVSNRASDFVSQSQLQLQKVMQTYNVTVSLINSMQTLLEEMNKSIAQNIR